jgi:hypothetical protein
MGETSLRFVTTQVNNTTQDLQDCSHHNPSHLTVLLNATAALDGFLFSLYISLFILFYTINVLSPRNPQFSSGTISEIHILLYM